MVFIGADIVSGDLRAGDSIDIRRDFRDRHPGVDGRTARLQVKVISSRIHKEGISAEKIMVYSRVCVVILPNRITAVLVADVSSHNRAIRTLIHGSDLDAGRSVLIDGIVVDSVVP